MTAHGWLAPPEQEQLDEAREEARELNRAADREWRELQAASRQLRRTRVPCTVTPGDPWSDVEWLPRGAR
jgi:hypothetical protein